MNNNLFLQRILYFSVTAATIVAGEYDFWSDANAHPPPDNCHHAGLPAPARLQVGDSLTLTYEQLCDFGGGFSNASSHDVQDVEYLESGRFVAFQTVLPVSGVFSLDITVASPAGQGAFDLKNMETGELYKIVPSVPSTGSWDAWTTVPAGKLHLPKGYSILQLESNQPGWNILSMKFTLEQTFDELVYAEPRANLRGKSTSTFTTNTGDEYDYLISAADFERPKGVALVNNNNDKNLENLFAGDALKFDLDLPDAGVYRVWATVANPMLTGALMITGQENHELYAETLSVIQTASYDEFERMLVGEIQIAEGGTTNALQVVILEGGFHLMHLGLDYVGPATSASQHGVAFALNAASEILSHDGAQVMDGGAVGELDPNDHMVYEVDVPKSGDYTISMIVATPSGNGAFSLHDMNTNVVLGQADSLPSTPNWWTGKAVDIPARLAAGKFQLKIAVEEGNWNLLSIVFRMQDETS